MLAVRQQPFLDLQKLWRKDWGLRQSHSDATALDMYEENRRLVIEINLPDFQHQEIRVSTRSNALEVYAHRDKGATQDFGRYYYFRENYTRFYRRIELPVRAIVEAADAILENGLLTISMPMRTLRLEGSEA